MNEVKICYTAEELAEALHLSKRTILDYLRTGQIKGSKIGRKWIISADEVKDFLNRGTDPHYRDEINAKRKAKKTAAPVA